MRHAVALVGLLFWTYCLVNIIAKRRLYSRIHLTVWSVILLAGYGWCIWMVGIFTATPSETMTISRSVLGVTLGSPFDVVSKILPLDQIEDPIIKLYSEMGLSEAADKERKITSATHRTVYKLVAPSRLLPQGITFVDFTFVDG